MADINSPRWLAWAREIQAISQTGLFYSNDKFNSERYHRLTEISAEIIQEYTGLPKSQTIENFLLQRGYATPKIDVRGAVICKGKILLVQERSDQKWCMPGGWVDIGETPSDMVKREVIEESGVQVNPKKIVGIFDANRSGAPFEFYHAYKIVFLCELKSGTPCPGTETQAVGFFSLDELPPLSIRRTNEVHIAEAFAHFKDRNRLAAFD